jgi:hypothetical protein
VSIVWVPFSVTARMRPFGLKATSAPLAAELDKARGRVRDADEGVRTGDPKRLDRVRALVQDVHEQAPDGDAYRSVPDTRDVGEVQAISLDFEQGYVVVAGVDDQHIIAVGGDRDRRLAAESRGRDARSTRSDGLLLRQRPVGRAGERDGAVSTRLVRLDVHMACRRRRHRGGCDERDRGAHPTVTATTPSRARCVMRPIPNLLP